METVRPVTSWRWLCIAGLALFAALMGMATVAGDARADNQVSATRSNQAIGIGTAALDKDLRSLSTSLSADSQVSTRARRPRVWKMPVSVAKRTTLSAAQSVYNNTTPNEFDESGSIIGESSWDEYGAADCERKSTSRVNCLGAVLAYFDVVDDADEVVGEDTFYCIWEQSVWYPRAKTKQLRTQLVDSACGWESDL